MDEGELEEARDLLREAMPLDSMIVDLWDWDIHFEDVLEDDWIREAAFGIEDSASWCIDALTELFLRECDEYDMDYDQHADPVVFNGLVREAATEFVRQWRSRLRALHPSLAGAK